jgi:hypothetical protein
MESLVVGMARAIRICKKQGVELSAVSEHRPLARLFERKIRDKNTWISYKECITKPVIYTSMYNIYACVVLWLMFRC